MTGKPTSKWGSLGRRVADLKDGESIVLESDDPRKEVKKIRDGLNGTRLSQKRRDVNQDSL